MFVRETHRHDMTIMSDRIAFTPSVRLDTKPGVFADDPGLFSMAMDLTESLAFND